MKGWRTVAFNVLSFLLVVLGWDQLTQWVSGEVIAEAVALVNFLLRFVTDTTIFSRV